jgi:hypothetical protein
MIRIRKAFNYESSQSATFFSAKALSIGKPIYFMLKNVLYEDPLAADEDAPQMLLQPLSSKLDRDKIKEQEREVPYRHFFTILN